MPTRRVCVGWMELFCVSKRDERFVNNGIFDERTYESSPTRRRCVSDGGRAVQVTLRETDYVEGGLGWRVWASGHVMCRGLLEREELVEGADILEVRRGAG